MPEGEQNNAQHRPAPRGEERIVEQFYEAPAQFYDESVDGFGGYGRQFQEVGGDAAIYTHLEIPGSYKGLRPWTGARYGEQAVTDTFGMVKNGGT